MKLQYLDQKEAQEIDQELMGDKYGFSIDQLMELAGLSVAAAVTAAYPPGSFPKKCPPRILVLCGPGNNGGDGFVAARHLQHFGYSLQIVYPKRVNKPLFNNLVKQCENMGVLVTEKIPEKEELTPENYDLILDAIFGFSFSGEIRAPFDKLITQVKETKIPIISIDIPSGWNVELGNVQKIGFEPSMLVSLTAPKKCALQFQGLHYLGGRFVPQPLADKYQLNLPKYSDSAQCVKLWPRL